MQTAPLKSFATWARTELIREVSARIAVVLAPASPLRIEQPKAVAALEAAIAAADGAGRGRGTVADWVAYTWFNRIIALRFMDANGYTGIGVVSPQAGVEVGQPEILGEAKRANIDPDVVSPKIRELVSALLDGTRSSDDPQGEAYALLLTEYCRHWNRAMPFMFERQGDFTELLMPANLLADDSLLNRAVRVLTEETCQDVEVIGWLYQFYISERKDEVFAGFKSNTKAGAAEIPAATQLFTPHWIVRYLVENSLGRLWILNRPMSGLANRMQYYVAPVGDTSEFLKISSPEELKLIDPACGSGHLLTYAFDLLYAIYEEEGYASSDIPGLILMNNLHGTEIDPRAGALAAFALTMKARARQRTFFTKHVQPNICVLSPVEFSESELDQLSAEGENLHGDREFWGQFRFADTLGALIRPDSERLASLRLVAKRISEQDDLLLTDVTDRAERVLKQAEYLTSRYHVVVANPPYMGSGNMGPTLSEFARQEYPRSKSDLMTMFMERGQSLTLLGGEWAMINLPTWTFLASSAKLRDEFLRSNRIRSMILTGRGVFGSDFGAVAFAVTRMKPNRDTRGVYRKLTTNNVEVRSNETIRAQFLDHDFGRFEISQSTFLDVPGEQLAFALTPDLLELFANRKQLGSIVEIRAGISTGDNSRFIRLWHEVSRQRICRGRGDAAPWKPHNKGGVFRRWYGNIEHVLKYSTDSVREMQELPGFRHDGRDVYFAPHVSWSEVTSGRPSFRFYPPGMTFGSGSKAIVGNDSDLMASLAYLNSAAVEELLSVLSPGMKTEVGHIAGLPAYAFGSASKEVTVLGQRAVDIARNDWDASETSLDFEALPVVDVRESCLATAVDLVQARWRQRQFELGGIEDQIDTIVWNSIGRQEWRTSKTRETERLAHADAFSHQFKSSAAIALVSYAVGCIFGRYSLDEPGLVLADEGGTLQDYLAAVPTPTFMPDGDNVIPIVDGDWFEDDIVTRFRQFLRVAFGESKFEENLRFVTEALGVKDLRDYFVKSFYKDHVQRYKRRPIYWLFSSPKGSFNALIYMHRYTPSTVSTVLNEYLREFNAKLEATLGQQEKLAAGGGTPRQQAAAQKEADRIRKMLLELDEYEHDVLYPLATQQIEIDLDDGVRVNYPKFGTALKKIPGLEVGE